MVWFRKNYKDLVRLYITMEGGPENRDILDDFMQACQQEEDFRTNIAINLNQSADEIVESKITPLTFKKFVRTDRGLQPTSPSKDVSKKLKLKIGVVCPRDWWYPKMSEKNKIKSNLNLGRSLLNIHWFQ